MLETSQLDKLVVPLKWGFLADNVLLLIERRLKGDFPLNEKEKNILHGATEFLDLVRAAIGNVKTQGINAGDLRRMVESLTLYSYAIQSTSLEKLPLDQVSDHLKQLSSTLTLWESGTTFDLKELNPLRVFFKSLGEVTLRESNELLAPRPRLSMPE